VRIVSLLSGRSSQANISKPRFSSTISLVPNQRGYRTLRGEAFLFGSMTTNETGYAAGNQVSDSLQRQVVSG
jgi:hypothetical protein